MTTVSVLSPCWRTISTSKHSLEMFLKSFSTLAWASGMSRVTVKTIMRPGPEASRVAVSW
jgi:hypothetical protein